MSAPDDQPEESADAHGSCAPSPGSALLEHAQAAFMEWIKMVELELGTAADWYGKTEAALRAGDVSAYGTAVGKAWGHTENALKLVRNATRRGFEPDSQAPNGLISRRESEKTSTEGEN